MTAKQLLEMTQLWYKTHEQWKWTSKQLAKKTRLVEELEGWRTALQMDNLQLRRELGYDETDGPYKRSTVTPATPNHDGRPETDGGVGSHSGISSQPKQSL